jgi:SNF2 family DNA or RNA helicase
LASLREGSVVGRLEVRLEESDAGIDWFDLSTAVSVTDQTLSPEELSLLMKTSGKWVRLEGKGWRRLEFSLSQSDEQALADLGIGRAQIAAGKQRFHALQLARLVGSDQSMVRGDQVERIRDRLDRIQTVVQPGVPTEIHATLRPYQVEGFQFLSYLSMNGFGGILADDMGLGKTLQTLSWIAWLRSVRGMTEKVLVVCPKSVQENWSTEVSRFLPGLRVKVWRGNEVGGMSMDEPVDLHVIGYAQLRSHEESLKRINWGAVILDEAQAIKNPSSQTARAACALQTRHRLALSGTPIENRLLDLWSIFAFAMPGILGTRSQFVRQFDAKEDALARRRLAARTRPFVLRRTKKEVARELPDRVEEDLLVELEGDQALLYRAELKRARAALLNANTQEQLDSLRFHLLTSLLRLRQICCHPRLVGFLGDSSTSESRVETPGMESSKVAALVELLEPLMQEGQKVLVFSQFTGVLEILEECFTALDWPVFKLTGKTEDRGDLVSSFQSQVGPGVFLISLKAGGFGLNLTAASYVVLFDPWWNPAVEAQAIDRTHRIGQKQTVFAYRLIVKGTIEEKIRELQRRKGAIAKDILGEEGFAQALTLSDFQFLLEE